MVIGCSISKAVHVGKRIESFIVDGNSKEKTENKQGLRLDEGFCNASDRFPGLTQPPYFCYLNIRGRRVSWPH